MGGVLVAVLTYNRLHDTLACLDAGRQLEGPVGAIVALDNGSTDGPPEAIRRAFPEVQVRELGGQPGLRGGEQSGPPHGAGAGDGRGVPPEQ